MAIWPLLIQGFAHIHDSNRRQHFKQIFEWGILGHYVGDVASRLPLIVPGQGPAPAVAADLRRSTDRIREAYDTYARDYDALDGGGLASVLGLEVGLSQTSLHDSMSEEPKSCTGLSAGSY